MKLNQIFCKHDYILVNKFIVHYPDYEPHKVGTVWRCSKCYKKKKKLYLPYDFIQEFGKDAYNKLIGR